MAIKNIELHIDKLVLHGFSPHDRYRIGEAVERQLTQMLTEQGMPASLSHGGKYSHLYGGSFNIVQGSKAETIGSQVAQSVYKNMNVSQRRQER
ncbi:outer membrane protein/protective antigen OMA87 [Candidatus Scalindua japonica]|uniref:Outer membrane protein/protective antigen OMA87 n=2 Tax=Candidatus Scalindua japonica TaxID=1284222 RepID=A0A286TW82_9BACT|nr:outer membrane protein/protective antigen OMA87 [Candidatus Scalindua japonica]